MAKTVPPIELPEIKIYHLEGRRSERIVWLMEELEFDYELIFKQGGLLRSMAMISKLGHGMPVAPTVEYGDQIMVESGAIIDTILSRHAPGRLVPAIDSPDYPYHLMWMHYAEGSLMGRVFNDYITRLFIPVRLPSPMVNSQDTMQYAEDYLEQHPWFGGEEFSAADIMMMFPINLAILLRVVSESQYPNISEWKERIESRPAYQRMIEKARPNGVPGMLPRIWWPSLPRKAKRRRKLGVRN